MVQLIACVNDDVAILSLMRDLLEDEGYRTVVAHERQKVHALLVQERPALVVLDLHMEHPDAGLKILEVMRLDPQTATIPTIICTADRQFIQEKTAYMQSQGYDTLEKPFALDALLDKVRAMIGPPTE